MTEVTAIRISALEKVDLKELMIKRGSLPFHNQYVKESSLSDDI